VAAVSPVWTVLVATTGCREAKFRRLLSGLLPQLDAAGGAVTVEALWNNGERPLSRVRQDLVEHATSEYVSFADDDDKVAETFVSSILPLLDGVDFAGFRVELDCDGVRCNPTIVSLENKGWIDAPDAYYRDITYVNPFRRDAAMAHADFTRGREYAGEDRDWAAQMRGHLVTEHYLDETMYYYHWSRGDSIQNGPMAPSWPQRQPGYYKRPQVTHPYFSWHPASKEQS